MNGMQVLAVELFGICAACISLSLGSSYMQLLFLLCFLGAMNGGVFPVTQRYNRSAEGLSIYSLALQRGGGHVSSTAKRSSLWDIERCILCWCRM